NFVERGSRRRLRAIHVRFAFDDVHRRELRQGYKPAERQRAQRILHPVYFLFPKRLAEPDPELLDVKTAPARRQKMPELVHDDEQIENDQDLDDDEDDATDVKNHCATESFFPDGGGRFRARPLIGGQYRIEIGMCNGAMSIYHLRNRLPDLWETDIPVQKRCDRDFVSRIHDRGQCPAGLARSPRQIERWKISVSRNLKFQFA